jgi:hypothetical protein
MMEASGKTLEEQIELLWDVLHEYQDSLSRCESNKHQEYRERRWASVCEAMSQLTEAAYSGETDPEEAFMQGEI